LFHFDARPQYLYFTTKLILYQGGKPKNIQETILVKKKDTFAISFQTNLHMLNSSLISGVVIKFYLWPKIKCRE